MSWMTFHLQYVSFFGWVFEECSAHCSQTFHFSFRYSVLLFSIWLNLNLNAFLTNLFLNWHWSTDWRWLQLCWSEIFCKDPGLCFRCERFNKLNLILLFRSFRMILALLYLFPLYHFRMLKLCISFYYVALSWSISWYCCSLIYHWFINCYSKWKHRMCLCWSLHFC